MRIAIIIPSIFTFSAVYFAITAVRFSYAGNAGLAVYYMFYAAVCDGIDGHVARILNATTDFGSELDSLCDMINFGICPILVVYFWAHLIPKTLEENILWSSCFFFICCCATRLAVFNIMNKNDSSSTAIKKKENQTKPSKIKSNTEDNQGVENNDDENNDIISIIKTEFKYLDKYINRKKFFLGVPAPCGAMLALQPLVYHEYFGVVRTNTELCVYLTLWLTFVAILMISPIRTISSKVLIRGTIKPDDPKTSHFHSKSVGTMILKLLLVFGLIYLIYNSFFQASLIVTIIYLIIIPLSHIMYHFLLTDAHNHEYCS